MRLTPIQIMLSDNDWHFIIDSLNDRRVNCLDLVESDGSLDDETVEDLMETATEADRIQGLITIAMQED